MLLLLSEKNESSIVLAKNQLECLLQRVFPECKVCISVFEHHPLPDDWWQQLYCTVDELDTPGTPTVAEVVDRLVKPLRELLRRMNEDRKYLFENMDSFKLAMGVSDN